MDARFEHVSPASAIVCPSRFKPEILTPQSDAEPSDYISSAQLYSAMRMFGTPNGTRLAAGQSDSTPLATVVDQFGQPKLQAVNYSSFGATTLMSGRTDKDTSLYRAAPHALNSVRGPIRAENFIGTTSSRVEFGELLSSRPNTGSYQPQSLNLTSTSANAECRAKEVLRLNKLNDAYVTARLKSVL